MDDLFFHPKLVHIPLALGALMPLIAGGLLLAWWRKWLPPRGWVVAVMLQAILVGSGIVALKTGETEEERVEAVVAERYIESHEEAAEAFVWTSAAVLGLMLLAAATSRRRAGLPVAAAATVGTLLVFGLGVRTGQQGGDLVYRHGAANAYVDDAAPRSPVPGARGHSEDHD